MQQFPLGIEQTAGEAPSFGAWLRRLRKASDLTQDDLAEQIGYATATIRKIEAGERRPSRDIAERLAQTLIANPAEHAAFVRAARGAPAAADAHTQDQPRAAAPQPPARSSLPSPPFPLIGRAEELAKVAQLLAEPACRLITLAGPGGAGKTHLALHAAELAAARFADGAAFVALAPHTSADALAPAIAEALGCPLSRPTDAQAQLLEHLRERQLLLVLDNLEHIVDGAAAPIAEIVQSAPGVKLLVTSRERLRLQGEWLIDVGGLPVPAGESARAIEASGAVALFLRQARQARPGFQPTGDDLRQIARICRLVEGLPLGIEMAAAWTRMLSCAEIAQEIERSLDFLVASARDIPQRHSSVRAVFDHSWRLLSDAERDLLRRLAVFRGGFTREAATSVVELSMKNEELRNADAQRLVPLSPFSILHVLASLVDKSLLRRAGPARYEMHELVRQYAAARLEDDPRERDAALTRHGAYFAAWLREREDALKGANQDATLRAIAAELDNLRLAWDRAIGDHDLETLGGMIYSYTRFYELRSRFKEGRDILRRAREALRADSLHAHTAVSEQRHLTVLGELLATEAWFATRLGQLDEAAALLHEALALAGQSDRSTAQMALVGLGIVAYRQGDYTAAQQLLDQSLAIARALGQQCWIGLNLSYQGLLARVRGEYQAARSLLEQSAALDRAEGQWRGTALSLSYLGAVHIALGEQARAQELLREALAVSGACGDRSAMATTLFHMGLAAQHEHALDEALYLLRESLGLFREIGDYWGSGHAQVALGSLAHERGVPQEAKGHFFDALTLAAATQTHPIALEALVGLAAVLAGTGAADRALDLLLYVEQHPATWARIRERAAHQAALLAAGLEIGQVEAARRRASTTTFQAVVDSLMSHTAQVSPRFARQAPGAWFRRDAV